MRFVALDLETTWLSPETDTIIEVAAVAFELEQDASGVWRTANVTEHSQLIYPEREMTEEISMITGITDAMLAGKPIWSDIRERVRDFIEGSETVIVGHNVLFDVGMLSTHGINLSEYPILDTFELSEILSQDVESLNLGYLAGRYGLSAGDKEHRALGDTRLSVGLFVHYLNMFPELSVRKKQILTLCGSWEAKRNIGIFVDIVGYSEALSIEELFWGDNQRESTPVRNEIKTPTESTIHLASLSPGRETEKSYLREVLEWRTGTIGVHGGEQVSYMMELLTELGISAHVHEHASEYISEEELRTILSRTDWERKEWILVTKLLFWREDTTTGLLRELKLYGEERTLIDYYRALPLEDNRYIEAQSTSWKVENLKKTFYYDFTDTDTLVVKDIWLLEEQVRRAQSVTIDFESTVWLLSYYRDTSELQDVLLWIAGLYGEFPERPTGDNPYPPWDYGETYFMTQNDIWCRGFESLALITNKLEVLWSEWKESRMIGSRRDTIRYTKIDRAIEFMIGYHRRESHYGAILNLTSWRLTITYIPRRVDDTIRSYFAHATDVYSYGPQIHGEKISGFLESEVGIDTADILKHGENPRDNIIVDENAIKKLIQENTIGGTVILTTSMKHVRKLGKSLEHTGKKILMQGISGGKWKQLWLFSQDRENTILIGTIDMWRDTLTLWGMASHIILAKLPFDPPTDPYFLARTVGMKNNFALYSEPMIIVKLTTLIERIRSAEYSESIYCLDNRLTETIWWQELLREIV